MITIVMTTYAPTDIRANYAEETLQSLLQNLVSKDRLQLFIADDGSSDDSYIKRMMIKASHVWRTPSMRTNSNRHGIGASLNLALKSVLDAWLYITDDW